MLLLKQKYVRQKDHSENAVAALVNLVILAKLKVTKSSIKKIIHHEGYPSLSVISACLKDWNVENMGVHLSVDDLKNIPYPAIAHLNINNGHFVTLHKLSGDKILYINPESGWVNEEVDVFTKKWTGKALLVAAPTEKSGEPNYEQERRAERISRLRTVSTYTLIVLAAAATVLQIFSSQVHIAAVTILFATKLCGLLLSVLLIEIQFSISDKFIQSICDSGKDFSCSGVLNSPASKVFGIGMSELGLMYFSVSSLMIFLSSLLQISDFAMLSLMTFAALPYTIFSIFYQWRIIKKWCPLCLGVMLIFWLEFIIIISAELPIIALGVRQLGLKLFVISLAFSALAWLVIRPMLQKVAGYNSAETALLRFKRSRKIFDALLQIQPTIIKRGMQVGITVGRDDAKNTLAMVTNPTCAPCARSHKVLDELMKAFPAELKVEFIFISDPEMGESVSTRVSKRIIQQSLSLNDNVDELINSWYAKQDKSTLDGWIGNDNIDTVDAEPILLRHYQWCGDVGITTTPAFLLNGRQIPSEYSFNDFVYHVRKILRAD